MMEGKKVKCWLTVELWAQPLCRKKGFSKRTWLRFQWIDQEPARQLNDTTSKHHLRMACLRSWADTKRLAKRCHTQLQTAETSIDSADSIESSTELSIHSWGHSLQWAQQLVTAIQVIVSTWQQRSKCDSIVVACRIHPHFLGFRVLGYLNLPMLLGFRVLGLLTLPMSICWGFKGWGLGFLGV